MEDTGNGADLASEAERASSRGGRRIWLIVLAVVIAAGFGMWGWAMPASAWRSVDNAAESVEAPRGFEDVAVVRQGPRFCAFMCSADDVSLTHVMTSGLSEAEACAGVEELISSVATEVTPVEGLGRCAWSAAMGDGVRVSGVVADRSIDFREFPSGYGYRWTEEIEVPDADLVAWVEVTAPL